VQSQLTQSSRSQPTSRTPPFAKQRAPPLGRRRHSRWTAMKEGLPGGTLSVSPKERARGGPFSCCTLDWI
jgi:hypothetical protein